MYALDFEYDGGLLSDYGFIICNFNSTSGADIIDAGSTITFNKVSRYRGKQFSLVGTQYDTCIQANFHICKNPDIFDDLKITDDEFRKIFRWLNRKEFLKFRVVDNEDLSESRFYYSSFNISKIKIGEVLYGIDLTMETDKPFAYGNEQVFYFEITDTSKSVLISDYSDEIGSLYPNVKIVCNEDGDLSISNSFDNSVVLIKNCKTGEKITLYGSTQIITSSLDNHDICNDFNYEFLKISNSIETRYNNITVSLPCCIEISYSPIIKDIP